MAKNRDALSNEGKKEGSPLNFRADEDLKDALREKCADLDLSRTDFVVTACRWLYHLSSENPDLAYWTDEKIAEHAHKVCSILVLLEKV